MMIKRLISLCLALIILLTGICFFYNSNNITLMVKKTIRYERFPSTNPNYYNRPVTAAGFEENRWFQLCSEVIA